MRKYVIKDPAAFVKSYPKLSKPDTRKIDSFIILGGLVDGVEIVDQPEEAHAETK